MDGMPSYMEPEMFQTLAYLLIVVGAWIWLGIAIYWFHRR